ncbi:glutamate racemase [Psychrobium sp. 1_MG-2023]|uniref:glutamate racemase n=1 Tax=Psychrobium sp. 1_MG-2023 TaxID=3062624 RepID=UPI002689BE72|nr:glutamate racemase [Psychrobium sp. 1_MG-2023]MDP2562269.1 glutamate racemase [Psychrobium sp. 1_MG-2023]
MTSRVLVFDSGVGGVSVFREITKLLPSVSIDYLFDNKFYPYGQLSEQQLITRLLELLPAVIELTQPDLLVIACNSASTVALPALRNTLRIPVVGVVPAIKPAALLSKSKKIGLVATQGTINRSYIDELMNAYAPQCELYKLGSNKLVQIAEMAFQGIEPNDKELIAIFEPVMGRIDTLILGCTHFPLLKKEIARVTEGKIVLVDSGIAIAQRVKSLLISDCKQRSKKPGGKIHHRAFYTEDSLEEMLNQSLLNEGFSSLSIVNHQLG